MLLKTNKKLKINRKSTRLQIKPQDIFASTRFFVRALFVRPIYSVTCFSLAVGLYFLTFSVTERELKKKKSHHYSVLKPERYFKDICAELLYRVVTKTN